MAIDPAETYELSPIRDMGLPEDQRRVLVLRHLSCREWKAMTSKALDETEKAGGVKELDGLLAALRTSVVDWRNMPNQNGYDPNALDLVLTNRDVNELTARMIEANGMTADQLKNFVSRWASGAGLSAPAVRADNDAATSPPPNSQLRSDVPSVTVADVTITEAATTVM